MIDHERLGTLVVKDVYGNTKKAFFGLTEPLFYFNLVYQLRKTFGKNYTSRRAKKYEII